MGRILRWIAAAVLLAMLVPGGCAEGTQTSEGGAEPMKMIVRIGEASFTATLEENRAVAELVEMMKRGPVTVEMDDYAGFEKVGSLGTRLSADDVQTVTEPGDIVLYSSSNIVMFYGSNSWAYTRLGRVDDLTGWEEALGGGSITAVFALEGE